MKLNIFPHHGWAFCEKIFALRHGKLLNLSRSKVTGWQILHIKLSVCVVIKLSLCAHHLDFHASKKSPQGAYKERETSKIGLLGDLIYPAAAYQRKDKISYLPKRFSEPSLLEPGVPVCRHVSPEIPKSTQILYFSTFGISWK